MIYTNKWTILFLLVSNICWADSTKPEKPTVPSNSRGSSKVGKQNNDIPPIIIKGNKFFYSNNGTRFFMRGIAYQQTLDGELLEAQKQDFYKEKLEQTLGPQHVKALNISNVALEIPSLDYLKDENVRYVDPLADEKSCLRDVSYLADLHVNLVRVYSINPLANHDVCMKALAEAGIYVISDLAEPYTSIKRDHPSWNTEVFDRYKSVVDSLARYNNVLGFFAGNEVANEAGNTDAAPFVKAAVRDVKAYIKQRKYREIPVGYSSNDDAATRMNLANYFICGEDPVDFYGINMYEWCGYSSFFSSGYSERTIEFQNYSVPLFFSEFGCNIVRPRPFQDVEALYSPLMTSVWSGGIVYMYFEEENKYGVVSIDKESGLVKKLDDYRFLRDAYGNVNPSSSSIKDTSGNVNPSSSNIKDTSGPNTIINCPSQSPQWKAHPSLPATPYNFKCECLEASLECIVSPQKKKHDFQNLYSLLCDEVDCTEIVGNGTSGQYGYYSDCDEKQKLSYLLNKYYLKYDRKPDKCDFDGQAFIITQASQQDLSNISKNSQTCANLLKSFSANETQGGKKKAKSNGNSGGSSNNSNPSKASRVNTYKLLYWAVLFFSTWGL